MTPRQLRVSRASAASAIATFFAAVSHTVGGGALPDPLLMLAVAVFLVPLAAVLVGGRASLTRIGLTVGVSQIAFHLLFHFFGGIESPGGGLGHHHQADFVSVALVAGLPPAQGTGMLVAHAVAAVLTTLLIWRGEALLGWIASWVQSLLRRTRIELAPPIGSPRFVPSPPAGFRALFLRGSIARRGPPAVSGG